MGRMSWTLIPVFYGRGVKKGENCVKFSIRSATVPRLGNCRILHGIKFWNTPSGLWISSKPSQHPYQACNQHVISTILSQDPLQLTMENHLVEVFMLRTAVALRISNPKLKFRTCLQYSPLTFLAPNSYPILDILNHTELGETVKSSIAIRR